MSVVGSRWLVTGAGGMLGLDLQVALRLAGVDEKQVSAKTREDLDVTDIEAVREAVRGHDVVVNAAAWTSVDDAEDQEAQAFAANAMGAANVARACREHGARLVHVSCADVLGGDAADEYAEDAPLAPRSAYGRSKAAGEWAVEAHCPAAWIVRTAWLYGGGRANFVRTMAQLAKEREKVSAIEDQRGQPTWTMDVARAILRLVDARAPFGVWHATSQGETTWHGFTQEIFRGLGLDPARVEPTTTDAFPRRARPGRHTPSSVMTGGGWRASPCCRGGRTASPGPSPRWSPSRRRLDSGHARRLRRCPVC